jgi:hypothetical protein
MFGWLAKFIHQWSLTSLVQVGSVLAVLMKILESTDFLRRIGRDRRSRWLREEIIAMQEFQAKAPAQLGDVITNQLDVLYKQYVTVATHQPRPGSLVYPTVPRWRQILLLYFPARLNALIPQILFYFWLIPILLLFGLWLKHPKDWDFVLAALLLSIGLVLIHDWAVRAERKRNKRGVMQTLLLTYPQPTLQANMIRSIFHAYVSLSIVYFIELLTGLTFLVLPPPFPPVSPMLEWGIIGFLMSLHDYARSFDVVPQESTVTHEKD